MKGHHPVNINYYNTESLFCQVIYVCYNKFFIYFFILFSINYFPIARYICLFILIETQMVPTLLSLSLLTFSRLLPTSLFLILMKSSLPATFISLSILSISRLVCGFLPTNYFLRQLVRVCHIFPFHSL